MGSPPIRPRRRLRATSSASPAPAVRHAAGPTAGSSSGLQEAEGDGDPVRGLHGMHARVILLAFEPNHLAFPGRDTLRDREAVLPEIARQHRLRDLVEGLFVKDRIAV